jgi:Family of unknown function (DUF6262)
MNWQRNTDGLKEAAQKKRLAAFAQTEAAIKQLLRQGHPITFEAVAQLAGVTRGWLYKQPDLKERITYLRDQSLPQKRTRQPVSEDSKGALIMTLRQQIKELRQEKELLNQQLEVAYGLAVGTTSVGLSPQQQSQVEQVEKLQMMLDQSLKDNQVLAQKNQQLQAQLQGLTLLEAEVAELTKQNQHLFNKVLQLTTTERDQDQRRFAEARRSTRQPEIPDVEF